MCEALRYRLGGRGRRPARRVHPVQGCQHPRGHRLHAERHPRVTGRADRGEELRPRRLGVGLGADFGVGRQHKVVPHHVQQRGQALPEQRWRPATHIHGMHRRCVQLGGRQFELRPQRQQPTVRADATQLGRGVGIEVAVPATGQAERDVQVDPERLSGHGRQAGQLNWCLPKYHAKSSHSAYQLGWPAM